MDTGAPVIQDYNIIESVQPNPATVDLDGDGNLEILYPSYDGRMHAFWLDKTEHHNWPYAVYTGGPYRFATEPVVADLDNDGHPEVVFASWVQKGTYQTGQLHILDYQANVLHEVDLPEAYGSPDWNGALAAPTLANIDADADLEVVLNTAHSGFVAYDLPGTANANVLWGTGRGNYQRTGSMIITQGMLQDPQVSVTPSQLSPGDTLTYTLWLENSGPMLPSVQVTSTLPAEVTYLGNLWATSGSYGEAGGVITWTGAVTDGEPVVIIYGATLSGGTMMPTALVNRVLIDDGLGNVWEREAIAIVNAYTTYLPVIVNQREQSRLLSPTARFKFHLPYRVAAEFVPREALPQLQAGDEEQRREAGEFFGREITEEESLAHPVEDLLAELDVAIGLVCPKGLVDKGEHVAQIERDRAQRWAWRRAMEGDERWDED